MSLPKLPTRESAVMLLNLLAETLTPDTKATT